MEANLPTPTDQLQDPKQIAMSDLENELNPEAKEFLKLYKTAQDALVLDFDTKRDFVKNYYVADNFYQERLEKMVDEAEEGLDAVLSDESIDETKRYQTEKLFMSLINLAKGRHLDELMAVVKVFYEARRKTVKGMDISDPICIMITQQCFQRMAIELPEIICKEIESECKARDMPLEKVMPIVSQILLSDLSINVDIERLWVLKKVEENKTKEITAKELKDYICYSLALSHKLIKGKLNPDMMILLPHILSDNLYNKTGYEGEEIVYHVQEMLNKNLLSAELVDLIIREAYAVEQGKEKSYAAFEEQMQQMAMMQQMQNMQVNPNAPQGQNGMPGMMPPMDGGMPGMMPPMDGGMMPPMPGMMPPMDGMMPPMGGMMPPMDGMMPPMGGMMPPMDGMMPPMPGMMPPNSQQVMPGGKTEEQLYNEFMELMSKSTYKNPLEDPAIQKMMMANAKPEEIEQIKQAQQMFDPKFIALAKSKEAEFEKSLPVEYQERMRKEREQMMKMQHEYQRQYNENMEKAQQQLKK